MSTLPFTVSITAVTPKTLPEYLDSINAIAKGFSRSPEWPLSTTTTGGVLSVMQKGYSETVLRHDLSMYQDWPVSTAVIDGEFWVMHKCGYSGTVLRYKGTNIETAVKQPDGRFNKTHSTWGTMVNPYILGGMWYDSAEKKLYAPLHCEYPSVEKGIVNRQTHLATSTDKGLTWNYEGPIITSDNPGNPRAEAEYSGSLWDGGEGDFYLYADERNGYVYVYSTHNLWPKPGTGAPRFWAHHVARCAISDKLAPGKWKRFYNGGWSEPGLGGKAAYVEAYNVIYSRHLGKYISFNYGGGLSVCSDLSKQDWTPSFRIPGGCWGCNDVWAFTLTDAGKTDVSRFDRTMFVYTYWHLKPGSVYRIDFGEGETPDTCGYTGAGVGASLPNTMNPIRPYGEPLYDNADPIESRRTREVRCESPEISYSGGWAGQDSPVKAKTSGTANSSVVFAFKGSGIYWRAATGPDGGKADVYLDEVFRKTVDLYGDFTPYLFAFIGTGLDADKAHTIRIVVRGEKNPKSSGTAVKHMSFEYSADSCKASAGFSSVMGKNNWYYQQWDGRAYSDLAFYAPDEEALYNYWHGEGNTRIGGDYQIADVNDPVRKWVAPHAGDVRIEGTIMPEKDSDQSVSARILKNSSAVWAVQSLTGETPASHDVTIPVNRGDAILFAAKRLGAKSSAKVFWDPAITYVE